MAKSTNPFATAKTAPAPVKAKKDDKQKVVIEGLATLADIDAVMKSLKAIRETVEADVKAKQKEHFVKEAVQSGKRPDNFRGVDGDASASCELRARSTNSTLSEEEQKLFRQYDLPMDVEVTIPETFIINPAYINDSALLERVGMAISKVKEVPEDFILKQEARQTVVAAKSALDMLCASKDENKISTLLGMVSVLAIKVGGDVKIDRALKTVASLLDADEDVMEAA